MHTVVVVKYARAKLKQSQLFEHGGINGIDDALQNRRLSNELEHGGIYLRNDVQDIYTYILVS